MATRTKRTEKLDIRLTPQAKQIIVAAAEASHRTVSEFVLHSAIDRANETLADQRRFFLNDEQWEAFQKVMDGPPRDLPGLRELLSRKAPWEK